MKPAIVLMLCLAAATAGRADELVPVPVGTRMRVTTSGTGGFTGTFQGTLARLDAKDLTLVDGDKGAVMTVPADSVTRVQVLAGTERKTRKGLLIGLTTGAVLGALAFSGFGDTGAGCGLGDVYTPCTAGTAAAGALLMGGMGAGIGALIGHSHHVDHWNDVGVERVHLQVAPVARGAQVAVSLRLGR